VVDYSLQTPMTSLGCRRSRARWSVSMRCSEPRAARGNRLFATECPARSARSEHIPIGWCPAIQANRSRRPFQDRSTAEHDMRECPHCRRHHDRVGISSATFLIVVCTAAGASSIACRDSFRDYAIAPTDVAIRTRAQRERTRRPRDASVMTRGVQSKFGAFERAAPSCRRGLLIIAAVGGDLRLAVLGGWRGPRHLVTFSRAARTVASVSSSPRRDRPGRTRRGPQWRSHLRGPNAPRSHDVTTMSMCSADREPASVDLATSAVASPTTTGSGVTISTFSVATVNPSGVRRLCARRPSAPTFKTPAPERVEVTVHQCSKDSMVSWTGTLMPSIPVKTWTRNRLGQEALDLARARHRDASSSDSSSRPGSR